jgi:uncharacterized protein (TIGR03435 family)
MARRRHRWLATLTVLTVVAPTGAAQDRPVSTEPAFEVVSVKVNLNDDAPEAISPSPDGSVRFTGFRLRTLIAMAYRAEGLQRFDQIIGGPTWIGVDRFDIVARANDQPGTQSGPTRVPERLRTVLRDRFRLRAHTDTRSMPAFALVVAGRDRKPGAQLRESTIDCSTAGAAAANPDPDRSCGIRREGGVIVGRGVPAGQLAGYLSGLPAVDRHVTDRTGLTGRYDFRLEYSPAFLEPGGAGPSLFTALTEQLGLTLRAETVPLPVLIIDSVEKPTPD